MVAFARLLLRAGWAPVAVVLLHQIVLRTPFRQPMDFTMHFLGGAAIAFFFFHALNFAQSVLGMNTLTGRFLFSFTLACTVGLFWEFGELLSDFYLHTHIQKTVRETLSDLFADATGAITSLALVLLALRLSHGPRTE